MLFIGVRVNNGFMSWRHFISQFLANLICLLWRYLLSLKGLYYVMRLNAAIFAPWFPCCLKLSFSIFHRLIDALRYFGPLLGIGQQLIRYFCSASLNCCHSACISF